MARENRWTLKGCTLWAAILLAIPVLAVSVVFVQTWQPLRQANKNLQELESRLGESAVFTPAASGAIAPERMELFLQVRTQLFTACAGYADLQRTFQTIASLDSTNSPDVGEVTDTFRMLGSASVKITPFLANYFALRNGALLQANMALEEYVYIYALAHHARLLAPATRAQVFSDDEALSPEASELLRVCLSRQADALDAEDPRRFLVRSEQNRMEEDPTRLIWQDGLPGAIVSSVQPFREALDAHFCAGTAGLEMERGARRAIGVALE